MRRKEYLLCYRCEREFPRSGFERRVNGSLNLNRCLACKAEIEFLRAHQTRICVRCKQELPVAAFDIVHKSGGIPNGHTPRCRACRALIRAYHQMPIAERFWRRFKRDPSTGCLIWQGAIFTDGYGVFSMGGKNRRAHIVSWELTNGPVPEGIRVCHNCPGGDNPACGEPSHLWLGTDLENMHDRDAKGRTARVRGSDRAVSRLTEAIVLEIRARYIPREVTLVFLAEEYGVCFQTISLIVNRKTWTHV